MIMTMMTSSSRNNTNSTNNSSSATVSARYPRYPAYRDSGVEWLGEIPAHWEVKRLKYTLPLRGGKLDSKPTDAIYLGLEHIESETGQLLLDTQPEEVDSVVATFEAGDVLFGKLRPYLAKVARPDFAGVCTSEILPLRPTRQITQDYGFYALLNTSLISAINSLTYGTRMPRVSPEQIGTYAIALPPLPEQRAIAAFLDRETARIDALIAKKERLIELLQEKRAAVITQAVTKGLDPTVPMKDSGVEWLGKVPAHWEVKPLMRCVIEKADYRGKTPEKTISGVFLVTARNVRMGSIDYEVSQEYVAEADYDEIMHRGLPKIGDVLFTTEAPLGNVALVDREDIALAQRIIRFRLNPIQCDSQYVLFSMMSDCFQRQLSMLSTGSTAEGLKASKLPMLRVALPPLEEQRVILDHLESIVARVDSLIAAVSRAIDGLREFRTAIISSAVTGKVDLRPLEDEP